MMNLRVLLLGLAVAMAMFSSATFAAEDSEEAAAAPGAHGAADDGHGDDGGHGDHAAESTGGGTNPLATDLDLAIWTFVIFVSLVVVLRAVAWDPIIKALAAREAGISDEISAAEAKHEEARALLAQHEAKIAKATDEVKAMLDEARRDAEVTKSTIVDEARSAAHAEKQRAIRDVELARDAAVKQLAEESANMAIDLASKVVKQDISADRQGEIVREAIGRLASAEPSSN